MIESSLMKRWIFWIGLLISLIFLYFAIRNLEIEEVFRYIQTINYYWIFLGIFIYFLAVMMRSLRWSILLSGSYPGNGMQLFSSICIGYMGNNVLPARAGEFLRAFHLKEKFKISFSTSLASIVVERIFDGLTMISFILVGLTNFSTNLVNMEISQFLNNILIIGSIIFLILFILLILLAIFPQKIRTIFEQILKFILPTKISLKILSIIDKFIKGLQTLKSIRQIITVFIYSIIIWLLEMGFYWFVQKSFGLNIPLLQLLLLVGALNLVASIPSAPGYIGVFDAPGIALLSATGIQAEISAAYILVLHAFLWLPITLVGAIYFFKEGLTWSSINKKTINEKKVE